MSANSGHGLDALIPPEYELLEKLGEGGSSVVYKAVHKLLNQVFVLKILSKQSPDNNDELQTLKKEARASASLDHPHIVKFLHLGFCTDGKPFLAFEFVHGKTLEEYLNSTNNQISAQILSQVFAQLCDALQYAHEKGLVHRDLSPANILLRESDSYQYLDLKVLDFGLARHSAEQANMPSEKTLAQTSGQVPKGTPAYMSPEQCKNQTLDTSSDIYSLSCLLYRCLLGRPPFEADSALELMYLHINQAPDLSSPDLSPALRKLLESGLAKEKKSRPGSAKEFQELLQKALKEKQVAEAEDTLTLNLAGLLRTKLALLLVAGVLIALLAIAGPILLNAKKEPDLADLKIEKSSVPKINTHPHARLEKLVSRILNSSPSKDKKLEAKAELLALLPELKTNPSYYLTALLLYAENLTNLGETGEAEKYWQKSIEFQTLHFGQVQEPALRAYVELAKLARQRKDFEAAEKYAKSAEKLIDQLANEETVRPELNLVSNYKVMNRSFVESTCYSLNALLASRKKEYSKAMAYIDKALDDLPVPWMSDGVGLPILAKADLFVSLGKKKEAVSLLWSCACDIESVDLEKRTDLSLRYRVGFDKKIGRLDSCKALLAIGLWFKAVNEPKLARTVCESSLKLARRFKLEDNQIQELEAEAKILEAGLP